ncbi:MAG: FAD binding domain-containing protein [Anaerolineales bacterium]|nr:FAD binding domain-containing protein [Anaerolineales bacterium]
MIVEYHRPETIEGALKLLTRDEPITVPLGGGTYINQPSPDPIAVVDLQALGMNTIQFRGNSLELGSTATLQQILNDASVHSVVKYAIRHEATYNRRQVATIAGTLVSADGRSPLATTLLAAGAQFVLMPGDETSSLGEIFPYRKDILKGGLITQVILPHQIQLAYTYTARTPADLPIVCAAVALWPSGRTRAVLGGFGLFPLLILDGPDSSGVEIAARDAYSEAGDQWASAAYRSDVAAVLIKRCLGQLI